MHASDESKVASPFSTISEFELLSPLASDKLKDKPGCRIPLREIVKMAVARTVDNAYLSDT
jgi:hypothetical protein